MNNVLYCGTYVFAGSSEDGQTPSQVVLTQENNCLLVWDMDYSGRRILHQYNAHERDRAIEVAVAITNERREERKL